jgi:hypothetical protein
MIFDDGRPTYTINPDEDDEDSDSLW